MGFPLASGDIVAFGNPDLRRLFPSTGPHHATAPPSHAAGETADGYPCVVFVSCPAGPDARPSVSFFLCFFFRPKSIKDSIRTLWLAGGCRLARARARVRL